MTVHVHPSGRHDDAITLFRIVQLMAPHRTMSVVLLALLAVGCSTTPPKEQHNICAVFDQHPEWYDYAQQSEQTWGTSKAIQMAFVRHESSFRGDAKPPFDWFLFIPLGRPSTATGYAQAQDPVWGEYQDERGSWFSSRGDMEDALDFIGWYNDKSHKQLGISKQNVRAMYLAYHEGRGGYKRGSYKKKPQLRKIADKVAKTAGEYAAQLKQCEERFQCRKWYKVGPFCS